MLILPASVSIFLTNAFSLVFKTNGGGIIILGGGFTTTIVFDAVSGFGMMAGGTTTCLTGVAVIFFVTGFETVTRFVVGGVFGVTTGGGCGFTHSRNVISSNAKSFPQPPGALSYIINRNVDVEAGVVK